MEKDPELRFQQASVMKTRVDDLGSGPAVQSLHASVTDAGFWKRFLAVCIDYNLVMIGLFPLLVVLATISPRTAVVRVPLGLFTVERIIENDPLERRNADGSKTVVYHRIVETTVLGKWKYLYHKEIADSKEQEELSSRLIDPVSRNDIHAVTAEHLAVWILMIYWILMESGRYQASIGKMLVGIKVGDKDGRRIGIARAAARNASKIISAIILMIGFMMAGWTRRKQALHDILPDCYVTDSPKRMGKEHSALKSESFGKKIAIGCGVLALVLVLGVAVALSFSSSIQEDEAKRAQQASQKAAETTHAETRNRPTKPTSIARPAQVFTLERGDPMGAVDLDTGKFVNYEPTGGINEPYFANRWKEDHGIDLLLDRHSASPGVLLTGTQVKEVAGEWWDETPEAEVVEAVLPPFDKTARFDERMAFLAAQGPSSGSKTHVYRTLTGSVGILRLGATHTSGGVRVEWRMIVDRHVAAEDTGTMVPPADPPAARKDRIAEAVQLYQEIQQLPYSPEFAPILQNPIRKPEDLKEFFARQSELVIEIERLLHGTETEQRWGELRGLQRQILEKVKRDGFTYEDHQNLQSVSKQLDDLILKLGGIRTLPPESPEAWRCPRIFPKRSRLRWPRPRWTCSKPAAFPKAAPNPKCSKRKTASPTSGSRSPKGWPAIILTRCSSPSRSPAAVCGRGAATNMSATRSSRPQLRLRCPPHLAMRHRLLLRKPPG